MRFDVSEGQSFKRYVKRSISPGIAKKMLQPMLGASRFQNRLRRINIPKY
jgi:hypothetical protein